MDAIDDLILLLIKRLFQTEHTISGKVASPVILCQQLMLPKNIYKPVAKKKKKLI